MNMVERARILIVSPHAPGHGFGGAERHLYDLALVLRAISKNVSFVSYVDSRPFGWFEKLLVRIEPMLASPLAIRRLSLPEADVIISVELMGVGVTHPGHIHLFFGSYSGFRDLALPSERGVRKIIRKLKSQVARVLERNTQHELGAVANSIGLRNVLRERNIPVRDEVLLPPTDCNRFSPGDKFTAREVLGLPQNKRLILFAGRWEYAKGADRIAQIFRVIPNHWHLVIATPSEFTFPPLAGPQVTILTDLQTEQMIDVYRAADVLLQPSRFEGYSLVVSEAQACGCPVLTSPVGQAFHLSNSEDPKVRAAVIPDPDSEHCWMNALFDLFSSEEIHVQYANAHRAYALKSVSYSAVQTEWQKFLSNIFEKYSWLPH